MTDKMGGKDKPVNPLDKSKSLVNRAQQMKEAALKKGGEAKKRIIEQRDRFVKEQTSKLKVAPANVEKYISDELEYIERNMAGMKGRSVLEAAGELERNQYNGIKPFEEDVDNIMQTEAEVKSVIETYNYISQVLFEAKKALDDSKQSALETNNKDVINAHYEASKKVDQLILSVTKMEIYDMMLPRNWKTPYSYEAGATRLTDKMNKEIDEVVKLFDDYRAISLKAGQKAVSQLMIDAEPLFGNTYVAKLREQFEAELAMNRELIKDDKPRDGSHEADYALKVKKDKYIAILDEYESEYREMSDYSIARDQDKLKELTQKVSAAYEEYSK
ncbi:MAG: hypothetical protein PHP74_03935 [Candidatus Gracilibacteria bacterium]|nr:hypothetical protein [Candidatus Gracilibacteria bacterium]